MVPKRRKDAMSGVKGGKKLDARDVAAAVKIFNKFDEKWVDKLLTTKKWM